MSRLHLVVFALGAVLVASFVACGPTNRCAPGACNGCCDATGACVSGAEATACGTNGASCSTCGQGACVSGVCTSADAGSMNGTDAGTGCVNCRGCCQNGVCRSGAMATACGVDGGVCVDCIAQNRTCVAGRCQAPCGPSNCNGCCRNNECITTTTVQACGRMGESCVLCQPREACLMGLCTPVDGGMASDAGGTCESTCTSGCCDVADVCQPGTQPSACGTLGGRCLTCASCMPYPVAGGGRCP
ncbi:MAG: hypothetical protein JNJ54_03925 [Myxococcaceae bacterium]|nr:hypothetical protein [Myxococcaceae bacterium]